MAASRCQVCGATWQNRCRRSSGSCTGRASGVNNCPPVPMVTVSAPGSSTPWPSAWQAWSEPPKTTGTPAGRPHCAANAGSSSPATSANSPTGGSCSGLQPGDFQQRRAPAARMRVKQQGGRGVGGFRAQLAGQAQAHVIFGQQQHAAVRRRFAARFLAARPNWPA